MVRVAAVVPGGRADAVHHRAEPGRGGELPVARPLVLAAFPVEEAGRGAWVDVAPPQREAFLVPRVEVHSAAFPVASSAEADHLAPRLRPEPLVEAACQGAWPRVARALRVDEVPREGEAPAGRASHRAEFLAAAPVAVAGRVAVVAEHPVA